MPGIVRMFDMNLFGGKAILGDFTFIVDNRPVVRTGSPVTPHAPCSPRSPLHCAAITGPGNFSFMVSGLPANSIGNVDTCFHPRATGSMSFII